MDADQRTFAPLRSEAHFGRVVSCWPERPTSLSGMLAEAGSQEPDRVAVTGGELTLTYREFAAAAAGIAAQLKDGGVGAGDRVALLAINSAEMAVCVFAIAHLGAILVPLSAREQPRGLSHALAISGAVAVICDKNLKGLIPADNGVPMVPGLVIGDDVRVDDTGAAGAPALVSEDDSAAILYTSGTTGLPKGAMLTGLGLIHQSLNFVALAGLSPSDRIGVVAPMSHITGLVLGLLAAVAAKATLLVAPPFKAAPFFDWAAEHRMSATVMVPAMYNLCLRADEFRHADLGPWRVGGYGGAPMPAATIAALAQALPHLSLTNLYGATETSSAMTAMPPAQTAERPTSVGLPVPGARILIMDPEGREVPRGETGEIWHGGPMIVPGYWENPAATEKEFCGGFWRSGDVGSMDADGVVTIHDRLKDMINRGGFKVFAAEVEAILS